MYGANEGTLEFKILFFVCDFINSGLTGLGLSGLYHPPFSGISRISGLLAFAGDKVAPCHIGN